MIGMRKLVSISFFMFCVLIGLLILLLTASIHTYNVLTDETVIAELRFERTGNREYVAYLRTGNRCEERKYPLVGDQWRIDAEFLKWKYWALLFSLDSQYRLDRLEGRYRSVEEQNTQPNVAHDLADGTAVDVVKLAGALGPLNFLIDATYGSSTYQDVDPRLVFFVSKTPTGIITRSEPRAAPVEGDADAIAIAIERGCGERPPLWPQIVAWTDEIVVSALSTLQREIQ
jgi:hypothetical protein